jgi:hypothetical protein
VSEDAEWCGQCFAPLVTEPEPEPEPPTATAGEPRPTGKAFWPCPVCDGRNALEADACTTCGTPFAVLMRAQSESRPKVDPRDAVVRSLIFPGFGHHLLGRTMDGVARGVLFGISAGMAVMLAFSGLDSAVVLTVFALFVIEAAGVYAMSAYEARRLASGGDVLVPSRTLMWVLVGVILLSIVALTFAFVSVTGR